MTIPLKTQQEIETMREGGSILARVIKELEAHVRPGVQTKELDRAAEALILRSGAKPAFKGYGGFPSSLCVSVNNEIVHGIPSERVLQEGDIVSLDLGLIWKGLYLDAARTVPVGTASAEAMHLIRSAKKALRLALKKTRSGSTFGDIGNTIQRFVESQGLSVVKELCGHGIGRALHEDPQIPNFGDRHTGPVLQEGMVFCIEPIIAAGDWQTTRTKEGVYCTRDGALSAHFEDTVVVVKNGCEVLTKW